MDNSNDDHLKNNNEEAINALIYWLNNSITIFEQNKLENLSSLSDPLLLMNILKEININNFSENSTLFSSSDEASKLLQFSHILNEIKFFFSISFKIDLEQFDFITLKPRELLNDKDSSLQYIILCEYILFIAVQQDYYLTLLEKFDEHNKNILCNILETKFPNDTIEGDIDAPSDFENDADINEKHEQEVKDNDDDLYANIAKLNSLENENKLLHDEVISLREKNQLLIKENQNLDDLQREYELKYQEASFSLSTYKNEQITEITEHTVDATSYLIQISELKGKVTQNDHMIKKLKEEKELLTGEYKEKILRLNKEIDRLKEIESRFNHLNHKLDKEKISIGEITKLKHKVSTNEITIKNLEDKIGTLKNIEETDKGKFFKKIEELNFQLSKEKHFNEDLLKEKENLIIRIVELENELDKYKKMNINLEDKLNINENNEELAVNEVNISLEQFERIQKNSSDEEIARLKSMLLNYEIKIKKLEKEPNDAIDNLKHKAEYLEKELNEKCRLYEEQLEALSSIIFALGVEVITNNESALNKKQINDKK